MKTNKKGFTLVELLVVIAILAILATVAVIGYTSFINRANLSNDEATIEMINENLAAASVTGKPATAGDAIGMLFKLGISGEKFNAYTNGYKYVYNLENNKFYLVDNTGAVIYPDAADKANLWALYTDEPSDRIEGFANYVATGTIFNTTAVDAVFNTNASYKFDLQKTGFLQCELPSNVTVVQGIVPAGNSANTAGDVKQMESATVSAGNTFYEDKVVTITSTKTAPEDSTFKDCVVQVQGTSPLKATDGVVFENCTFVGASGSKWAIEVTGAVTIRNCTFNGVRGINIVSPTMSVSGEIVIENNTFNLVKNNEKANCIQIAATVESLTVKNNTFASGNAVVVVHASCANGNNAVTVSTLSGKINFSGNTFGELTNGNVVPDPDPAQDQANMDALVNFFKGIIK